MLNMLFMSSTFPGYNLIVSLFSGIHSSCNPAFPFDLPMQNGTFNSCNMGMSVLPDMYTRSPRAAGPRDEGVHIRQNTSAHVTTIMYHFNCEWVNISDSHFIYIQKLARFDYGFQFLPPKNLIMHFLLYRHL